MTEYTTMPESLYAFSTTRFNLITVNTSSQASPFNPFSRSDGPSYECWQAELTFKPRKGDDLDDLIQFIMRLRGGKALARIYDRSRTAVQNRTQPRGAGGAGPVVNAAADAEAGDETITIGSLLASQAVALKAIDHLGIGENLHAVLNSGASDSGGEGTFTIRPPLRQGVAEGDPISLVKPTGLFRLTGGGDAITLHGVTQISQDVTLSFIEEPEFG